mmetsp:Transcript_3900/g.7419  ORF Transcript_3900/g.7419 Transcript_3900/m.7419 type:complete len:285 (+) Transcript_3900:550-1404(+)
MLCAMRNRQPKSNINGVNTAVDTPPAPSLDFFRMPERAVSRGRKRQQVVSHASRQSMQRRKSWKSKLDPVYHLPLDRVATVEFINTELLPKMTITLTKGYYMDLSFFSSNGCALMRAFMEVWLSQDKFREEIDQISTSFSINTNRSISKVLKRQSSRTSSRSVDMDNFAGQQIRKAIKNETPADAVKWEVKRMCIDFYDGKYECICFLSVSKDFTKICFLLLALTLMCFENSEGEAKAIPPETEIGKNVKDCNTLHPLTHQHQSLLMEAELVQVASDRSLSFYL